VPVIEVDSIVRSFDGVRAVNGVSFLVDSGEVVCLLEAAQVIFRQLNRWEIDWYTALGEGMDKAGGYGVQEKGMVLVKAIEGDFYTVMGLPVASLWQTLQQVGYLRSDL
jgi:septum formation protein